jgi:hypothetical protein
VTILRPDGRSSGRTGGGPPAGKIGIAVVVAGWIVLAVLYFAFQWPYGAVFFLAVAIVTFVLGCLAVHAAMAARRGWPEPLRLPEWIRDFEEYFGWLTPVAFTAGLIYAHFFWH